MKKILQIDVRDDGLAIVECNIGNELEMMRLTAAIVTLCYNDPAFKAAMVSACRLMLEKQSESKEAARLAQIAGAAKMFGNNKAKS